MGHTRVKVQQLSHITNPSPPHNGKSTTIITYHQPITVTQWQKYNNYHISPTYHHHTTVKVQQLSHITNPSPPHNGKSTTIITYHQPITTTMAKVQQLSHITNPSPPHNGKSTIIITYHQPITTTQR